MIEDDYAYDCPYCGAQLTVRLDPSGGRKQHFVQDCEVCCRPVRITAHFQNGEVEFFSAETEE